jgi:hypothetical protein
MTIKQVSLDYIHDHPMNAHTTTERERRKIANNIRRTGRYPPLIVHELDENSEHWPGEPGHYQILDGHQRRRIFEALMEEGLSQFGVITVDDWTPLSDDEALIALATLNSWGANVPRQRAELLHAITRFTALPDAAAILPESQRQIQDAQKLLKRPVADIQRLIEKAEQPDEVMMSFVIGEGTQKAALARFTAAAQLFATFYGAELTNTKIREADGGRARIAVMTFQVQNAAKAIVEEALKRASANAPPGSRNKRGRALEELARLYLSVTLDGDIPIGKVGELLEEAPPSPKD